MNAIHETAIIGPYVTLGSGNSIGPYAVLGGRVTIGDNNWIGGGVQIGCPPEVRSVQHSSNWIESEDGPGVSIGNANILREAVQIHGGWHEITTLKNDLFIMNRSYVAHDALLEDGVTIASGVALGGHTRIGRGANIGLGSTVHQRRVVGALAMVGMSSVVTRDVEPFAKAYGNPCRAHGVNHFALERAGFGSGAIARLVEVSSDGYLNLDEELPVLAADLAWYREATTR